MIKHLPQIIAATVLVSIITAFFVLGWHDYITLDQLKEQKGLLHAYYKENNALVIILFLLAYIAVTALSLPISVFFTLMAGAIFGLVFGTLLASFASAVGATIAFLIARFVGRDFIQKRYTEQLESFNEGFDRDGPVYLFALRMMPIMPFFVINIVMALTKIRAFTFYWISQLGVLPYTAVYVYAGTQLAKINEIEDIASPSMLAALALLGLLPIVARASVKYIGRKQASENRVKGYSHSK